MNGIRGRLQQKAVVLAAVALAAVALAACGSNGSAGSASSGNSGGAVVSASQLAQMKATLSAQEQIPTYTAPGPAIANIASLRGDKVMVIPVSSQITTCEQQANVEAVIGPLLGMKVTVFNNSGDPSQWSEGIEDAVNGGYKAIIIECGIDPTAIAPQLTAAKKAGIVVVDQNVNDASVSQVSPLITAETTAWEDLQQQYNVMQAFIESGGKPMDALVITSDENVPAPGMVQAIQSEYSKLCGSACKVEVEDVSIPDWSTKVQPTVSAALLADPKITAIFCIYGGMINGAIPAVESAHRSGVHIYTFGGGNDQLKLEEGSNIVLSNFGPSGVWAGYLAYYQALLGLTHQKVLPPADAATPDRDFTPATANQIFTPDGGMGTAFLNGYRQLFGLPPLSGQALIAAASYDDSL